MILLSNLEINNSWEASHNCVSDSYHIFQAKIYYPGVTIAYMFPPYVLMYVVREPSVPRWLIYPILSYTFHFEGLKHEVHERQNFNEVLIEW